MTEAQINILIGFILGLIPPLIKGLYNRIRSLKKKIEFMNLIKNTYILPIHKLLLDARNSKVDVLTIINEIESLVKKLSYLKNEELEYLNSEEQFFYIRVIEFAKRKLYLIHTQLKGYKYVPMQEGNITRQHNEYEKENINKSLEIIDEYLDNVDDYAKLNID